MDLRSRIKLQIAFRFIFLTVMASSGAVLHIFYGEPFSRQLATLIVSGLSFSFVSTVVFILLRRSRGEFGHSLMGWSQIAWDLGYTSVLAYLTGGLQSAFVLLYGIQILMAAIVFMSRGALVASLTSAFGVFCVTASQYRSSEIAAEASIFTRLLFSASVLLLFGGIIAWLFKSRERLALRLERADHDLKELHELHSAIIDHIPSGIIYADKSLKISLMNGAALKILERSYVGQHLKNTPLSNWVEAELRAESKLGAKTIGHHTTRLPDGGCLLVFQDVTSVRDLESKMNLNEKLASVGQLAAGIAHEIRNPLASVSGSIQLMKSELSPAAGCEKLMRIVLRETDRLDQLLQNFLTYAKPSSLNLREVNIGDAFEDVVALFKNSEEYLKLKTTIQISIDKDLKCICDGGQFKQILWNLVKNAVEAAGVGGKVNLSARLLPQMGEERVRFSIKDSGPGIPQDVLPRIFDPFFTTKNEGSGLGLALVFQMVRAHGGKIWVESESDSMTAFQFEFYKNGPQTAVQNESISAA